ncbi:MAG: phosphomannomutase, partial [Deltaproteobacteria bacterium HGW-Deltaproteobacteria-20]
AMAAYPASGEINRRVKDAGAAIAAVEERFAGQGGRRDDTDGLSLEFEQWRFNLRSSNTEPVLRLNVESRGDRALMEERTKEILGIVDAMD